jgi:uncharacterized coiled-coil protein SlyX
MGGVLKIATKTKECFNVKYISTNSLENIFLDLNKLLNEKECEELIESKKISRYKDTLLVPEDYGLIFIDFTSKKIFVGQGYKRLSYFKENAFFEVEDNYSFEYSCDFLKNNFNLIESFKIYGSEEIYSTEKDLESTLEKIKKIQESTKKNISKEELPNFIYNNTQFNFKNWCLFDEMEESLKPLYKHLKETESLTLEEQSIWEEYFEDY